LLFSLTALGCGGGGGGDGEAGPAIDLGAFPAATVVIGQADFFTIQANQGGGPTGANTLITPLKSPGAVLSGGQEVCLVCDNNNHRILIYATIPTTDNVDADFVLGQDDFTSNTPGLSASQFDNPRAVSSGADALAVLDTGNSRVLLWPGVPKNNVPAKAVVGQPDFTSNGSGTTASTFMFPGDVQVAGGRLFVVDGGNHRVMIWNTIPTTNGVPADVVLGQPDFTSNASGTTASSLDRPQGVWSDGTRVAVADEFNSRVLIWNSIPTTNGAPADVVLGQPDFTSSAPGIGASGLNRPWDVSSNGTQFFIADAENHRVMIHDVFPTTSNRPADALVGQGDFAHGTANDIDQDGFRDSVGSARTFDLPTGILAVGNRLVVVDSDNSRVLVFGP